MTSVISRRRRSRQAPAPERHNVAQGDDAETNFYPVDNNMEEIMINSVNADNSLCLICGQGVIVCDVDEKVFNDDGDVIKQEVIKEDADADDDNVAQVCRNNGDDTLTECSNSQGPNTSGSGKHKDSSGDYSTFGAVEDMPSSSEKSLKRTEWTETEKLIYHWFLIWFKIKLTTVLGKRNRSTRSSIGGGWDGNSRNDPLPFCAVCKKRLFKLLEFQWKIEELEEQIKAGIGDMKEKADSCEQVFRNNGVYTKDPRYRRVRIQLVTDFNNLRRPYLAKSPILAETKCRRESLRKKSPFESYDEEASVPDVHVTGGPSNSKTRLQPVDPKILIADTDVKPDIFEISRVDDTRNKCNVGDADKTTLKKPDQEELTEENTKRSGIATKRKKQGLHSIKNASSTCVDDISCSDEDAYGDDEEYTPKKLAKSTTRIRPTTSEKRKRKIVKRLEEDDEDWLLSVDDEKEENDDNDEDLNGDQLKRGNYMVDPEKRTLTYKTLLFHQIEPFTENRYRCSECGEEVKHRNIRIRCHYLQAHTDTLTCKQCGFRAAWHQTLKEHIRVVHKGLDRSKRRAPAPCRICGKPLGMSHRKRHEWTHKNEEEKREAIARDDKDLPWDRRGGKRFQCEECGRDFGVVKELLRHKEHVHGSEESRESRKELCPECGGKFISLLQHRKRVHGLESKSYTCLEPGCGKVCKSLTQLTQHKDAVHRKIRPYKCNLCPREFTKEKGLKNHMNLHNGIRPLQCPHCPMAFTIKSNLQRHVQTYHVPGSAPKRKSFRRGPSMLGTDVRKRDLISQGIYLPPSALASWAAGREPTSHFPKEMCTTSESLSRQRSHMRT